MFDSCGHQRNDYVRYDCSKSGSETVFQKFFFFKYLICYKCTPRKYWVNAFCQNLSLGKENKLYLTVLIYNFLKVRKFRASYQLLIHVVSLVWTRFNFQSFTPLWNMQHWFRYTSSMILNIPFTFLCAT